MFGKRIRPASSSPSSPSIARPAASGINLEAACAVHTIHTQWMLRRLRPHHSISLSKFVTISSAVHASTAVSLPSSPLQRAMISEISVFRYGVQNQVSVGIPETSSFCPHLLHLEPTSAHCCLLKNGTLYHGYTLTSLLMGYANVRDSVSSLRLLREEAAQYDNVTWIVTLTVLSRKHHFQGVIDLFQEMVRTFRQMESMALVIVLSALSKCSELTKGWVLHCMIVKRGFDSDTSVCNVLVDFYAKCGDLASSESVFDVVESKDIVTWNSLIRGCMFNGFTEKVLLYFRKMSLSGFLFDQVSLSCVLSACSCMTRLCGFGEMVHCCAVKLNYLSHTSVANSLISFYAKYFMVEAAENVFKNLLTKNIVSWNTMISGLAQNGKPAEALCALQEMQTAMSVQPDSVTMLVILHLCAQFSLFHEGKAIHGLIVRRDLGTLDLCLSNSLMDMYAKCADLTTANIIFNTISCRDVISWNIMISGYSHSGSKKEQAWCLFRELLETGLSCTVGTLLGILPSFICPKDLYLGKLVHCWMLKCGLLNSVVAINALMSMYINCGDLSSCSFLFKGILLASDVVSWNILIVGCVQNGCFKYALEVFISMLRFHHTKPDPITLVSMISACGQLDFLFFGKCLHGFTLKAFMASHIRVQNALITMYSRCKDMKSSELIFLRTEDRNLCSWNCIISGYAQNHENVRALELFHMMGSLQPDEITMVCLLCVCSQLGALREGRQIHGHVIRLSVLDNNYITASLVDMYSKCGQLDRAVCLFERCVNKSVVTWNAMIMAYGFYGYGIEAITLFSNMCELGGAPTKSTFISVLSACSHNGLIDEGWRYFNMMSEVYGIEPTTEHLVCIVDMLGRAGKTNEAHDFIKKVSMKAEPGVWGALLSACKDHTNLGIGKSVAEYLFRKEPKNVGYYVSLSNLYAAFGKWNDAVIVRRLIANKGLAKPRGYSFI